MKWTREILKTVLIGLLVLGLVPGLSEGKPPPEKGAVREFYSSGRIRLEYRYKQGLLVRKRFWYENGQLMGDYIYREGRPYKKTDYYKSGRLKSTWTRKSGILKFFRADGSLKVKVSSRGDGLFH